MSVESLKWLTNKNTESNKNILFYVHCEIVFVNILEFIVIVTNIIGE